MASVVHVIIGLGNGGAEKTLRKVSALDSKNSHTIISLAGPGHHGAQMRAAGGHVHCLGLKAWNLLSVLRRINRLRCVREADVIASWMPHAIVLSPFYHRSREAKLVINLRASSYGRPFGNFYRKLLLSMWSVIFGETVDVIITPGDATAIAHKSLRLDREKFMVIPNGFEKARALETRASLLPIQSAVSHRTEPSDIFRIGMFARWHPQKNHLGFLRALFLLSEGGVDFRAVMAGPGIDWENKKLVQTIARYGLEQKIELLGTLESLEDVSRKIDVHVVASSYGEAFPNVAAETMLEGIPNVVTKVGDAASIVGSSGWLVEPGDIVALYEALRDAEASKSELELRGKLAAERIYRLFPLTKMVNSYSELFEDLANRSNVKQK